MGKREEPVLKSREEVIASLLNDGVLSEDAIAEMVAQAAVDEARKLMHKQRLAAAQPPTPPKPQRAKKPSPPKHIFTQNVCVGP